MEVGTDLGERREMALALLVVGVEVVDLEPLAGELGGQAADPVVADQPAGLGDQDVRVVEPSLCGGLAQVVVGHRGPEEIAEPAGELPVRDRAGRVPRAGPLDPVEERRRDQDSGHHEPQRVLMPELLRAEGPIQCPQFLILVLRQRPTIGPCGQAHELIELLRLRGGLHLQRGLVRGRDRLPPRLDLRRLALLRGEAEHLVEVLVDLDGILADVVQLVPEPVEPRPLGVVEHQPGEGLVGSEELDHRDDLVHRDDLAEAEPRGERAAELIERGVEPGTDPAAVPGQDRQPGPQPVERRGRALRELQLNAPLGAGAGLELAGHDEFATRDQVGGQADLQHSRGVDAEALRVDGLTVRPLAEEPRIESPAR